MARKQHNILKKDKIVYNSGNRGLFYIKNLRTKNAFLLLKSREKREKAVQRREAIRGIITERKGVSGGLRLDSPRLYKKCRLSASSGRGVCPGAAARRHFLEKPNKNTRLVLSDRLYIRDTRAARAYR